MDAAKVFKLNIMKHPTCKIDDWFIEYKQVDYVDRYVYIKHIEDSINMECKIQHNFFQMNQTLPYQLHIKIEAFYKKRWQSFLKRIDKYNKFLDKQ